MRRFLLKQALKLLPLMELSCKNIWRTLDLLRNLLELRLLRGPWRSYICSGHPTHLLIRWMLAWYDTHTYDLINAMTIICHRKLGNGFTIALIPPNASTPSSHASGLQEVPSISSIAITSLSLHRRRLDSRRVIQSFWVHFRMLPLSYGRPWHLRIGRSTLRLQKTGLRKPHQSIFSQGTF